jgi:hypothetical protein
MRLLKDLEKVGKHKKNIDLNFFVIKSKAI